MKDIYCFAGHRVEIDSLYPAVHELCREYHTGGLPEYHIRISPADIGREREKSAEEERVEGLPPRCFSDGYLESLAVYRRLADCLLEKDVLLIHGSAIAVDGLGYLFTAGSGTGKSTHARLWRELLGNRAVMVNDDKPLLEIMDGGVKVHGTPWAGKHRLSRNISVPLKAVCLLERGEANCISPITVQEALPVLLQRSNFPVALDKLEKTLQLTNRLARGTELYRLRCNMDPEAARTAYKGMNKGANI